VLEPTSIRSGFVGAGLPKRLATAAGVPGAAAIPDDAQLFLGFTSTQRKALGPRRIANLESLKGTTDQWPGGYFRHGTVMHLSQSLRGSRRVVFGTRLPLPRVGDVQAGLEPPEARKRSPEDPSVLQTQQQVTDGFVENGIVGHSASLQPQSRLGRRRSTTTESSTRPGTALVQRADFNTRLRLERRAVPDDAVLDEAVGHLLLRLQDARVLRERLRALRRLKARPERRPHAEEVVAFPNTTRRDPRRDARGASRSRA